MNNLLCRVATVVVALLLSLASAEAQEKSRDARDFELGRATEILANIMREFESGYVDEVSADRLLESAAMGLVEATVPFSE